MFHADYIAPLIQALSKWFMLLGFCIVLFLIQFVDRMLLCLGCSWIKFKKVKPKINMVPFKVEDIEGSVCIYPMVLVQIPICNEKEVCHQTSAFHFF